MQRGSASLSIVHAAGAAVLAQAQLRGLDDSEAAAASTTTHGSLEVNIDVAMLAMAVSILDGER